MKERFSANGTIENWLDASLEALKQAGFKNIVYNGMSNTIAGEKNGSILVSINPLRDDKTELALESASKENLDDYKKNVARIFQEITRKKEPEEEPLGGLPEEYKPNPEERFKPAFPQEEIKKEESKPVEKTPDTTREWYQSNWFTLLMLFLIPPLGIYLMWKNGLFTEGSRKCLSVLFGIYTFLWLWLLYLSVASVGNSSRGAGSGGSSDSSEQARQVNEYWTQPEIANYVNQMPPLMSTYEGLYVNNSLGTEEGNATALSIFPQVRALIDPVLAMPELRDNNAAYTLQKKINESAETFRQAIAEAEAGINSGDINAINSSTVTWNNAQNLFYEINYVYSQALLSTESEELVQQNPEAAVPENTEEIQPESTGN